MTNSFRARLIQVLAAPAYLGWHDDELAAARADAVLDLLLHVTQDQLAAALEKRAQQTAPPPPMTAETLLTSIERWKRMNDRTTPRD